MIRVRSPHQADLTSVDDDLDVPWLGSTALHGRSFAEQFSSLRNGIENLPAKLPLRSMSSYRDTDNMAMIYHMMELPLSN